MRRRPVPGIGGCSRRGGAGSRSLASLRQRRAGEKEGRVGDGANAVAPPRLPHSSETIFILDRFLSERWQRRNMAGNLSRRQLRVHRESCPTTYEPEGGAGFQRDVSLTAGAQRSWRHDRESLAGQDPDRRPDARLRGGRRAGRDRSPRPRRDPRPDRQRLGAGPLPPPRQGRQGRRQTLPRGGDRSLPGPR